MGPKPRPVEDRFWAKVDKRGPDECWGWNASTHLFGYGKIYVGIGADGRKVLKDAHKFSWELAHGVAVPDGLQVRHTCDNPRCCNPGHLVLGTRTDNMQDVTRRQRWNRKLTLADVAAIRSRRASGEGIVPISKDFGISHSMVSHICSGRAYRSIP